MVAVFDGGGWSLGAAASHGDLVFSDASFFLVRVSAPEAFTLVASGTEIDRHTDGGRQHVTYAAGPARDFFLAAGRRFVERSATRGVITLRSTTLPEYDETSDRALQITGDALGIFQTMFGDYPYDELDIVTTDLDALGMEYPGLFAIALPLFEPDSADYPPVYLEATLVHELAHQWFFNLVGNDPAEEPWLDEALAQFATLAYFEQAHGPSGGQGFLQSLRERWQRVSRAAIPVGLPAASYTSLEYGAIVYGRGPLFVDELRRTLGEPVFDEFLRDYVESNRWGIATTRGFQAMAEEHCGCSLTSLFDDWVYPP
jgi:aminopeptidase N